MMTLDRRLSETSDVGGGTAFGSLWTHMSVWARTCADYYAASAAYEELSCLSDAELRRRGLSRHTLARQVTAAYERGDHR